MQSSRCPRAVVAASTASALDDRHRDGGAANDVARTRSSRPRLRRCPRAIVALLGRSSPGRRRRELRCPRAVVAASTASASDDRYRDGGTANNVARVRSSRPRPRRGLDRVRLRESSPGRWRPRAVVVLPARGRRGLDCVRVGRSSANDVALARSSRCPPPAMTTNPKCVPVRLPSSSDYYLDDVLATSNGTMHHTVASSSLLFNVFLMKLLFFLI